MATTNQDPKPGKKPLIHILVSQQTKDLLHALRTEVLKTDTAVIISLIHEEAKRRKLPIA
jgi:hypothetical protein